jgi:hypothetical protein
MDPAVAAKVAVVEPAVIESAPGTVSICELLERVIATLPVPAACESATVQVDRARELSSVGEHDSDANAAVPLPETVASNSTGRSPFTSAITEVIEPAVPAPMVKVTEACP